MVETVTAVALVVFGSALLFGIVYTEVLAYYERKREAEYRAEFLRKQARK